MPELGRIHKRIKAMSHGERILELQLLIYQGFLENPNELMHTVVAMLDLCMDDADHRLEEEMTRQSGLEN